MANKDSTYKFNITLTVKDTNEYLAHGIFDGIPVVLANLVNGEFNYGVPKGKVIEVSVSKTHLKK